MIEQINTIRAALTFLDARFGWSPGEAPAIDTLRAALPELESHLAQYEAGDMASAAAQGFRDGVASVAQQPQAEVVPQDVGQLEYRGNSVAYIHQKMTAYRGAIDAAWQAMRDAGHPPDGCTPLAQAITKALAPQQAEAVPPDVVRDAERYRHLRNNAARQWRNGPGLYWYLPRGMTGDAGERLDAAIDAALAQQKGGV